MGDVVKTVAKPMAIGGMIGGLASAGYSGGAIGASIGSLFGGAKGALDHMTPKMPELPEMPDFSGVFDNLSMNAPAPVSTGEEGIRAGTKSRLKNKRQALLLTKGKDRGTNLTLGGAAPTLG